MTPWWWRGAPIRGPMISSVPITIRPASKAIIPGTEKRECAPCTAGSEMPSRTRPSGGHRKPGPLTPADAGAEAALGHDRQQHDAAGEHDLHD